MFTIAIGELTSVGENIKWPLPLLQNIAMFAIPHCSPFPNFPLYHVVGLLLISYAEAGF